MIAAPSVDGGLLFKSYQDRVEPDEFISFAFQIASGMVSAAN